MGFTITWTPIRISWNVRNVDRDSSIFNNITDNDNEQDSVATIQANNDARLEKVETVQTSRHQNIQQQFEQDRTISASQYETTMLAHQHLTELMEKMLVAPRSVNIDTTRTRDSSLTDETKSHSPERRRKRRTHIKETGNQQETTPDDTAMGDDDGYSSEERAIEQSCWDPPKFDPKNCASL